MSDTFKKEEAHSPTVSEILQTEDEKKEEKPAENTQA
jgi:hypothetical protein